MKKIIFAAAVLIVLLGGATPVFKVVTAFQPLFRTNSQLPGICVSHGKEMGLYS